MGYRKSIIFHKLSQNIDDNVQHVRKAQPTIHQMSGFLYLSHVEARDIADIAITGGCSDVCPKFSNRGLP